MREYEQIKKISKKIGYKGFTELQEKAFQEPLNFDLRKWLFVIGATSSGKTLIPLLNYFYEYKRYKQERKNYKMLFAVPYRALASQKKEEIDDFANKLQLTLKIVLSTGEFRNDDISILNGDVDVAVIIYEKIFLFTSMKNDFLKQYNLLVLDEIGLIQSHSRGIKADFILVQAAIHAPLRVIALGTPFYNWDNYIKAYCFFRIQENKRPICLETFPIYYTKDGVNHIVKGCHAVHEGLFPSLNNTICTKNPRHRLDFIIEDICTYHLQKNHKILIFVNSREEVRLLAQRLSLSLLKKDILSAWLDEKECKKYVRERIQISNDDELYGIMDTDDYRAFAHGIGYHNADVPASLRTLVEKEFLEKKGSLRILCSTETLVYGINSNADVVIIPNMTKQHIGNQKQDIFLYANEYMNYAGRAGRLDSEIPIGEQKHIGYIYPFIKAEYDIPDDERRNPDKDQKLLWDKLQMEIQDPQQIISCYFKIDELERPFYLLSLFPNKWDTSAESSIISSKILEDYIKKIPYEKKYTFDNQAYIMNPLDMLLYRKLICIENDCDDEDEYFEPEYRLTDAGKKLAGYVICLDDFDALMEVAFQCITEKNVYKVDILFGIIESKEITEFINKNISPISDYYPQILEKSVSEIKYLFEQKYNLMSAKLYKELKIDLKKYDKWIILKQYKNLANSKKFRKQRILFALLMWGDEQYTVKHIYDAFAIGYMQMKRFAEMISYRLDIMNYALPVVYVDGKSLYQKLGYRRIHEVEEWLRKLSEEIFYRAPAYICDFLDFQCTNPKKALKIRDAAKVYSYLNNIKKKDNPPNNKERKKIKIYANKIKEWEPEWKKAFYNQFGGILDYGNQND